MCKARRLVDALRSDLENIRQRLHEVNTGRVFGVDGNMSAIAKAIGNIDSIRDSLPNIIRGVDN